MGDRLAALADGRPVLPVKDNPSPCAATTPFLKAVHGGVPAISCDCSYLTKLPESSNWPLVNPTDCAPNFVQGFLNTMMSNKDATGVPWKLGTPVIFGCRA
jgi:hypothetical protein